MKARVLFVDDQVELHDVVRAALADEFELCTATSGEEALELMANEEPFAAVIADYCMEGMTGTEFLARARAESPTTVRALATGQGRFEVACEALRLSAVFRILSKPFTRDDLCECVRECVEAHLQMLEDRALAIELSFVRGALSDLTDALEDRVRSQTDQLRRIDLISNTISRARTLEEVGMGAATGLAAILGRGVSIEFDQGFAHVRGLSYDSGAGLAGVEEIIEHPIDSPDGRVGVVRIADRDLSGVTIADEERSILAAVAASTGVAVVGQMRRHERDNAQHTTVFALAHLAERRDNETGLHLERVAQYCRLVALGLREDGLHVDTITDGFVDDLVRSSPLHDIGKVGIPDSILLKPGKLTEEEWVIMRQHPTIGADTLRSILDQTVAPPSFLAMAQDIARYHHERWDGSGYPEQLSGAEIPLSARIVALADCYDALTTRRPYKEPWTHAAALAYLSEKAGTQFDADIVGAFKKRETVADEIRERLSDTDDQAAKAVQAA